MKRITIILVSAALALVSCSKENGDTPWSGVLTAPEVTITEGTASLTASWPEVKGAEGYRCEVTYVSGGRNVDVLKTNITETSFTVSALRPETDYTVRVAATRGGKASANWFMEDRKTGKFNVTFDITPYEVYNSTTGHIDYMAKVKPSDDGVYYWIAAVPYSQKVDAKVWMMDEIADAVDAGETWESLEKNGYIVKGEAESVFAFNGKDDYMFTAGILEHVGDQINVVSEVSLGYPFYAENAEDQTSHQCAYSDYIGEWVVKPYDVSEYGNGWSLADSKPFTVRISAKEDGQTFNMTGWGGADNKYSTTPIVLDYVAGDADRFEHFNINVPQDITTENGIKWAYTGWMSLVFSDENGNKEVKAYTPYDYDYDNTASETNPSGWRQAFRGYVANANKTVIKIFANEYQYEGLTVYMQSLWVCGMDAAGKYDFNNTAHSLNGNRGGIPNAMYYLVRKDVAEGAELAAPDVSAELKGATSSAAAGNRSIVLRVSR